MGPIFYTCQNKECKIPCPCSPCCSRITKYSMMSSSKKKLTFWQYGVCKSIALMSHFPTNVIWSNTLAFHVPVKETFFIISPFTSNFTVVANSLGEKNFKLYPDTEIDLKSRIKKNEEFLRSVCPECNNKFCDPYYRKKHVEFEHDLKAPFACDFCPNTFHSKQATMKVVNTLKNKSNCLVRSVERNSLLK